MTRQQMRRTEAETKTSLTQQSTKKAEQRAKMKKCDWSSKRSSFLSLLNKLLKYYLIIEFYGSTYRASTSKDSFVRRHWQNRQSLIMSLHREKRSILNYIEKM